MASFASSSTTGGARKHAWTKKKNVGENNGQLRFVRHHVWRTQARLDQHHLCLNKCRQRRCYISYLLESLVSSLENALFSFVVSSKGRHNENTDHCYPYFLLFLLLSLFQCSVAEAWTNPSPLSIYYVLSRKCWLRRFWNCYRLFGQVETQKVSRFHLRGDPTGVEIGYVLFKNTLVLRFQAGTDSYKVLTLEYSFQKTA